MNELVNCSQFCLCLCRCTVCVCVGVDNKDYSFFSLISASVQFILGDMF